MDSPPFSRLRAMRSLVLTVLLLLLPVTPTAMAAVSDGIKSNNLTDPAVSTLAESPAHAPGVSAADLYLFGVISLGILGLFWIRRHTSEL